MSHTVHYTPPESPLRARPIRHYTFRPHHTYLLPELWEHEHGRNAESGTSLPPRMSQWSPPLKNNIRSLRNAEQMTQEELALRTGVSRQTIWSIEHGDSAPSVLLALKIAAVLGAPVTEVFRAVMPSLSR